MPRIAVSLKSPTLVGLLSLCLLPTVACGGNAGRTPGCESLADCATGLLCVDGQCVTNIVRDSGTTGFDAGFRFDAGTSRRDAGKPDAGRPDTGRPDTGRPDTGRPDTGLSDGAYPPYDGGLCGPAICQARNAECGDVLDECGTAIACGSCPSGERCEEEGQFANQCRCAPLSCEQLDAECGTVVDNCGVMRECPRCSRSRDVCRNNECCTPRGCDGRCGRVSDGCGNKLDCNAPQRRWTSKAMFSRARNLPVGGADLSWLDVNRGVDFDGFGARIICPSVPMSQVSDRLYLTGAGLNVPSDATILGVEISFSMRRDGTDPELDRVNIMTGSFPSPSKVSVNRARSVSLSSLSDNFRHFTFGGSSDTWSLRLTPEEVNSDGFGVMLSARYGPACDAPNTQFVVDAAEVRIRYEEPCR